MTGWGRIVVLSASVGAGHDAAAGELARRLRQRGFQVDIYDFLALLPGGMGRAASRGYAHTLRWTPWWYGLLFGIGRRLPGAGRATARLLAPAGRRLLGLLTGDVRAVVSVYPLASQVLGGLRRRGLMSVPAITYVTDLGVHPMWLAAGIDLHCVLHRGVAAEALRLGAVNVRVTAPALAPGFHPGARPSDRRPVALVVGGSWGVGRLERTVRDLIHTGLVTPIVVCGRNSRLRERLTRRRSGGWFTGLLRSMARRVPHGAGLGRVTDMPGLMTRVFSDGAAFGRATDMPGLMRSVDVLVDNAGGQTTLQAMASGLPVLSYRPLPGHGRLNTVAMDRIGLAHWVRRRRGLERGLIEVRSRVGLSIMDGPDPAQAIAELASGATAVSLA